MVNGLRAVLFDLDGTLANTIPLCVSAMQEAVLRTTGEPFSYEQIFAEFGITEEGILRKLAGERHEDAVKEFLKIYEAGHSEITLFEGMNDVLQLLQSSRVQLGLVTGKGAGSAAISAEYLRLAALFREVRTGSADRDIKAENIADILERFATPAKQAAYVGDAPSDIVGARKAGVLAIAAAWAPSANAQQLSDAKPDLLFESVNDFTSWLKKD